MIGQSNDTNYVDKDNLKQGYWRILGKDRKLPNYNPNQLIEEGNYVNSRKQGLWKKYFPNGNIKSKITFINSRPKGLYETYYENGQLEEKGYWIRHRQSVYAGNYVTSKDFYSNQFWRYSSDGCLEIWKHYRKDTITEIKEYVTCDCLLYEVVLDTATGLAVKKEYENGKLIETRPFTLEMEKAFNDSIALYNGQFKEYEFEWSTDYYNKSRKERKKISKSSFNQEVTDKEFAGEGKFKLYNDNKQILKEGIFKRYRLIDGKSYVYDENGVLILIKLYKRGRYIGAEPIPIKEK